MAYFIEIAFDADTLAQKMRKTREDAAGNQPEKIRASANEVIADFNEQMECAKV